MMAFFKHKDLLLPVKRVLEVHTKVKYKGSAKITDVTENQKIESLAKFKRIPYILVETDNGNWISSGRANIVENALGIEIQPQLYYSIDEVDYEVEA